MANLTSVGITSGVPSSGTGTVSTIDNLLLLGAPISNSSLVQVAITGAASAATSSMSALVVTLSPNNVNPNGQAVMANSAPVVIASNQSAVPTSISAVTTGGCTLFTSVLASGTNATNVKGTPGQVYKVEGFNNSGTIAYLKMYNSSATPTAGSGTPIATYMFPANSGFISTLEVGDVYSAGIGFTATAGIANSDASALTSSAYMINIHYK
jgi:hypothetical protein